jgi:hypothetical protein
MRRPSLRSLRRNFSRGVVAAVASWQFAAASAVEINGLGFSNHSHDNFNDTPPNASSPFFTSTLHANAANGTQYFLSASNGLAGSVKTPNGPDDSPFGPTTVVSGRVTIVGNSTSAGEWLDGNTLPSGVRLSFDVSFTISAANGSNLITAAGNTGNGLGIANAADQFYGAIDPGETLLISTIATSDPVWTGEPTEPYTFTPISIGVTRFNSFRSNSFAEATAGATLSDGVNTWGFGQSTGTIASGLVMENNFNATFAGAGGDVPLTFTTESGSWNLKGFRLATPVAYEIAPLTSVNADFNTDGVVDGADFLAWQQHYGLTENALLEQGDADGNGAVDDLDLVAWQDAHGTVSAPPASATAVPEPAALALAASGLLGLSARRRR